MKEENSSIVTDWRDSKRIAEFHDIFFLDRLTKFAILSLQSFHEIRDFFLSRLIKFAIFFCSCLTKLAFFFSMTV